MLKKTVTYKNLFTDEDVTQDLYFHLSKVEILELEVNTDGGLEEAMNRISQSKDNKEIWEIFKKFVLLSYGKREGSEFVKSDEMRKAFESSQAYDVFTMSLLESDTPEADMTEFFNGIVPKDMVEEAAKIAQTNNDATKSELKSVSKPEPRIVTRKEILEMPDAEFRAGLADGTLKLAE